MRTLITAFLVLLVLILINRERVFVRDPLATVYRNDAKLDGAQVFINYSSDVLLERDTDTAGTQSLSNPAVSSETLIQGWDKTPGVPTILHCIRWMACLTDADHATTLPLDWTGKGRYDPRVAMSKGAVSYVDGDGATIRIDLR
jgi:hypothetical protein